jgi:hypothetical protein
MPKGRHESDKHEAGKHTAGKLTADARDNGPHTGNGFQMGTARIAAKDIITRLLDGGRE